MLSYSGQYTIPLGTAADGDADVVVVVVLGSLPSLQVDSSSWAAHACTGSGSGPTGGDDSIDDGAMDGIVVSSAAVRALMEQEERIITHNARFHGNDARQRGTMMQHAVQIMFSFLWVRSSS